MTINCLAAAATIFSFSSAPPPPFTRLKRGSTWSAPSMATSIVQALSDSMRGMPDCLARRGGIVRGRYGLDLQSRAHAFTKRHNQVFRGRAGAKPDDHAVADVVGGFQRCLPLLEIEIGFARVMMEWLVPVARPQMPHRAARFCRSSRLSRESDSLTACNGLCL